MSDKERIDWSLAAHGSPVITGLKPANLFSIEEAQFCDWQKAVRDSLADLADKHLTCMPLRKAKGKILLLVYHKEAMELLFRDKERRQFLLGYGYGLDLSLEQCLSVLSRRMNNGAGFPHEIGIFLAYPLEDVIGFIQNEGRDSKLCGYWKVYGDADQAALQFKHFREASAAILRALQNGLCLTDAVRQLRLSVEASAS